LRHEEKFINVYIWCAVGAALGWLFTRMMDAPARSAQIENILIGMFGAFIGGEFVAAQLGAVAKDGSFQIGALALAVAGALVILALLKLMRKWVGPMYKSKSGAKKRDW
jgi:uncharacterized membrane protein YeaQ/YmgE (transglycosylase-associated protein family)